MLKRKRLLKSTSPGVSGPVRLARGPQDYAGMRTGDVVVIDIAGLEAPDAQVLVDRGVAAVLNMKSSSGFRYPNRGPQVLADGGIPLVDELGEGFWNRLRNGEIVRVDGARVNRGEDLIATGVEMTAERISASLSSASKDLSHRLDSVTANAADQLRRERAMLFEGEKIPQIDTRIKKRPVVVVQDAHDVVADLKGIKRFIKDHDPVLIGVESGADVLLNAGFKPDLVIGVTEYISDRAVKKADEIVITSASGRLDRPERYEQGGKKAVVFAATGTAADLAILLADSYEAAVIVLAGAPPRLAELLKHDSADVASTFVARLRAGSRLVDAKAVKYFVTQRVSWAIPLFLLIAGLIAVAVAIAVTPVGQQWVTDISNGTGDFYTWIRGNFS